MRAFLIIFVSIICFNLNAQTTSNQDTEAILAVLESQRKSWSNGNIEAFMDGYWKNDSLKFYGANGITHGWKNTLENYKKDYPTKEHTGILDFKINAISKITNDAYYVMGEFFLKRSVGDANGIFMIIFKKIDGEWKIIADTSC